jgi:DNA-binding response OmpR family regulator
MVAWKTEINSAPRRTVLIVSQNREMIPIWKSLFEQRNCLMISESTPEAAMQTAHILSPSLIVVDLVLPQNEKLALCEKLRASTNGALLLLAPLAEKQHTFEYIHAGVNEHITAPVSPLTLLVKSMAWLTHQELTSFET